MTDITLTHAELEAMLDRDVVVKYIDTSTT
jgi:hypothetical protein